MLVVLAGLLSACSLSLGNDEKQPSAPVIKAFTINGADLDDNYGLIITEPQTLDLRAEVSSSSPLVKVEIVAKTGDTTTTLQTCEGTPCTYAWPVNAADNGIYSFVITAEDDRGASVSLPFQNTLAIEIE